MAFICGTSNPLLRLRVEEVHVGEIGNEQHAIAGRARCLRRYPGDHFVPRSLEKDQSVGTEWFDYGGRRFDRRPSRGGLAPDQVLRPQSEDHGPAEPAPATLRVLR